MLRIRARRQRTRQEIAMINCVAVASLYALLLSVAATALGFFDLSDMSLTPGAICIAVNATFLIYSQIATRR